MKDASFSLFDALLARYPYAPNTAAARKTMSRLEAVRANLSQIPPEYRDALFELTDSLDIFTYYKAHHAFLLGLDLGLSLSETLEPFQQFQGTPPSSFSARG